MSDAIPRPEYPRPSCVRPDWLNLNGEWQFIFDDADRGRRSGWESGQAFARQIIVPFTFEAALSGIGETAVHPVLWYRRSVDLPREYLSGRLLLHIGACDYETSIWVNGRAVAMHRGGYTPIACEIQDAVRAGSNEIVIRVEDRPLWSQPRGKQIVGAEPFLIDYDRVTGIWQSVWLEPVPEVYIVEPWSHFHLEDSCLTVEVQTNREFGGELEVLVFAAGAEVARARTYMQERREGKLTLRIPTPRLWKPATPFLYDLTLRLREGETIVDEVQTYAGLRELSRRGRSVLLNGQPFYFRGVLDQGYFPDGWYTAASDDDLRRDIVLAQSLGFNGARKHQKVEDPRWLYWADRLGFMVWGEIGSGRDFCVAQQTDLTREWMEAVRRDRMHPAIMAWVPLNESWGVDAVEHDIRQQQWVRSLYHLTKSLDPTRLVIANDGWQYQVGDVWGLHSYIDQGDALATHLRRALCEPATELAPGRPAALPGADVADLPIMLTEFGGVSYRDASRPRGAQESSESWGYHVAADAGAFEGSVRDLVDSARQLDELSGDVWTQLTDVQQETNGLLYFDRTPKLSADVLRQIFSTPGK